MVINIGLGSAEGNLDFRRLTLQEITLIGTYTYTNDDFRAAAEAICTGRMGLLDWMERRPLGAGQSAFKGVLAGRVASPKVILNSTNLEK